MEITSSPSRRLQLIVGEFSRGPQRPRVISAAGAGWERGRGGGEEGCRHLHCYSGLVFSQKQGGLPIVLKAIIKKKPNPLLARWQLPGTADGTFPGSFGFVFMDPSGREPINSVGRLKECHFQAGQSVVVSNEKLYKFDQSEKGKEAEPRMDSLSLALKIWWQKIVSED